MRRNPESMAKFGVYFYGVVKSLIVEIPIGPRADEIIRFVHRVPVRFSRSSKSRCFSSQ